MDKMRRPLPGQKVGESCLDCWSIQTPRAPGSHPAGQRPGLAHRPASASASGTEAEAEACCGCGLCYSSWLGWHHCKSN